jgi:hypothetical protein
MTGHGLLKSDKGFSKSIHGIFRELFKPKPNNSKNIGPNSCKKTFIPPEDATKLKTPPAITSVILAFKAKENKIEKNNSTQEIIKTINQYLGLTIKMVKRIPTISINMLNLSFCLRIKD